MGKRERHKDLAVWRASENALLIARSPFQNHELRQAWEQESVKYG
jgi:hypothetical protein